jgi:hypothetical protein
VAHLFAPSKPLLRASHLRAQGVRDYLCNRMYTLNEDHVESYLSQIVALAILRPSPALERLLLDFCSRSVRLACKARSRIHQLCNGYRG